MVSLYARLTFAVAGWGEAGVVGLEVVRVAAAAEDCITFKPISVSTDTQQPTCLFMTERLHLDCPTSSSCADSSYLGGGCGGGDGGGSGSGDGGGKGGGLGGGTGGGLHARRCQVWASSYPALCNWNLPDYFITSQP